MPTQTRPWNVSISIQLTVPLLILLVVCLKNIIYNDWQTCYGHTSVGDEITPLELIVTTPPEQATLNDADDYDLSSTASELDPDTSDLDNDKEVIFVLQYCRSDNIHINNGVPS